jgi:hypothetical protein
VWSTSRAGLKLKACLGSILELYSRPAATFIQLAHPCSSNYATHIRINIRISGTHGQHFFQILVGKDSLIRMPRDCRNATLLTAWHVGVNPQTLASRTKAIGGPPAAAGLPTLASLGPAPGFRSSPLHPSSPFQISTKIPELVVSRTKGSATRYKRLEVGNSTKIT